MLWALALVANLQAVAGPARSFNGLRAELNAADTVLRIRVTAVQLLDPTVPTMEGRPERLQVDVDVIRVLAGSGISAGDRQRVVFAAREYFDWARDLSGYEILAGVHTGSDMTALMSRTGDGWTVRTLFRAYDAERTDAFFAEYARLARLDDRLFAIGLARHLADRVAGRPDRLLWARWALLAFDDWDRLRKAGQVRAPQLRRFSQDALQAVLKQIDAAVRGKGKGIDLSELPWLIRLLSDRQRRQLAAGLLRLHPMIAVELREAAKAIPRSPDVRAGDPYDELTLEDIRLMAADADEMWLIHSLEACIDPEAPAWKHLPREEALRRARAFAR